MVLKNDNIYFEPESVGTSDWSWNLGRLITDIFQAISRGHNPENGILTKPVGYSSTGLFKITFWGSCPLLIAWKVSLIFETIWTDINVMVDQDLEINYLSVFENIQTRSLTVNSLL